MSKLTLVGAPPPPEDRPADDRPKVHLRAVTGRFLALCHADCPDTGHWSDNPVQVTCQRCLGMARRRPRVPRGLR